MKKGEWEIFHVLYRVPKFGTENEYLPEEHTFIVQTQGGAKDAQEACRKYHPGCNITAVLDKLSEAAGVSSDEIERMNKHGSKRTHKA